MSQPDPRIVATRKGPSNLCRTPRAVSLHKRRQRWAGRSLSGHSFEAGARSPGEGDQRPAVAAQTDLCHELARLSPNEPLIAEISSDLAWHGQRLMTLS